MFHGSALPVARQMRSEANEKTKQPIAIGTIIGWIGCPAMLAGVRMGVPPRLLFRMHALDEVRRRVVPFRACPAPAQCGIDWGQSPFPPKKGTDHLAGTRRGPHSSNAQTPGIGAMNRPVTVETSPSQLSDPALAARVAAGDHGAIRFLVKRHNQTLFRTARAILREDGEAEDAVQEAYVKAIRGIGGFRSDAKLSTWLTRIVVNEALGRLRGRKRAAEVIPLAADIDAEGHMRDAPDEVTPTPEAAALRAEARRIMEDR